MKQNEKSAQTRRKRQIIEPIMAHETAAVGKVRLYLEAKGLVDRDTFSKVKIVSQSHCPASNNQKNK
jgi:hypothetical protein